MVIKETAVYILALLGVTLFSLLFAGITFGFWLQFSLSIAGLCLLAISCDKNGMRQLFRDSGNVFMSLLWGIITAGILYIAFVFFRYMAEHVFSFAYIEISDVYKLKNNIPQWIITVLLLFVIGPGEEIFWRGYLQRNLTNRFGFVGVVIGVIAYTGAHLASGNLMLIAAAAVCGTFWALLFVRFKSIWLNIFSHVIWDVAIFVLLPLG